MPQRDSYHNAVRSALIADGWRVTHDPYTITFAERRVFIDLGAEQHTIAKDRGMENVTRYRQILVKLMQDEAQCAPSHDDIVAYAICDTKHDQYQVLHLGWGRTGRVFAVILHARIAEGKIWVERDGTEEGLANRLVMCGVPKDEIVLGFLPAWKRPLSKYAVV